MTRSRWIIPLVLAVTVFVHYLDRNNLAIVLPQIAREFGWDDSQIGQYGNLLLGAFYLTFGVAQVILSPLAERWGVRRSLMASVAGFSVCTMLFYPLGGSLGALIALRLLLGAAESVHMPMNSALVGRWFAPREPRPVRLRRLPPRRLVANVPRNERQANCQPRRAQQQKGRPPAEPLRQRHDD